MTTSNALDIMSAGIHGGLNNLVSTGHNWLNRVFPQDRRQELWGKIVKFATEKPKFAAFLLSQFALSGFPLALFAVMTLGIFVFAILAGLLIGLLGALVFTAFCVGTALLVLLPTLFMTTAAASFVFLWGLGTYYLLRWFNRKEIPGIHKPLDDSVDNSVKNSIPTGLLNGQTSQDSANDQGPSQQHEEDVESVSSQTLQEQKSRKLPLFHHQDGRRSPARERKPVKASGNEFIENIGSLKKKTDIGSTTKGLDGTSNAVAGL